MAGEKSVWEKVKGFLSGVWGKVRLSGSDEEKRDFVPFYYAADESDTAMNNYVFFRFWLVGLAIVGVGYLIFQTFSFLVLILVALVLSIALESLVGFWQRRGMARGFAIGLSYFLFLVFLLSGFVFVFPFLVTQLSVLAQLFFDSLRGFADQVASVGLIPFVENAAWIPAFLQDSILEFLQSPENSQFAQGELQENIRSFVQYGTGYFQDLTGFALNLVGGIFTFLANVVIVMTFAVLFSIEKNGVIHFLSTLAGKKNAPLAKKKVLRIYEKLGQWLKGQIFLGVYIGVIVYLALRVLELFGLGLPSKGTLALISGLTEFIPYLGPLIGGLPAVLLAVLHHGFLGFVVVLLVYYLIQRTENNILIPYVMNQALGVSPSLILFCVVLGGVLLGLVGVLLGVPFAVILHVLLQHEERE